jgi:DNA invertase Pin-like site-specific DNA recombinase
MTDSDKPYVYGYVAAAKGELAPTTEEQSQAIAKKVVAELADVGEWAGIQEEDPAGAHLTWEERPILSKLLHDLRRDDHLIVLRPDRLDRAPGPFAEALAYLARRSIHVHFIDCGGMAFDLNPKLGEIVATVFGKFNGAFQEARRESAKEVCRQRSKLGLAIGGFPLYGFRRITKKHGKVDEWCPKQCEILRELKQRRDRGEVWERIAKDFCTRGLRTGGNQRWVRKRKHRGEVSYDVSRIRRALKWYRDLLARGEDLGA